MHSAAVEDLLYSCMLAPPSERRSRLDEMCSRHPASAAELRAQFERLCRMGLISLGGENAMPAGSPAIPTKLGSYEIEGILGVGGVGVVYRGRQPSLGNRPVAVKALRPEFLGSERGEARFVREGLLAARLQHPNLCPVLDVGKDGGIPYLAMPLIEGVSLAASLERARQANPVQAAHGSRRDAPLRTSSRDWRADVALAETLARAVHYAHGKGLLHRDIKPGNIIVQPGGDPVLLDFGLARDLDAEAVGLTGSGELLGTPAYMAPEQAKPRGHTTDARTDVYGLGATLFEMLTLELPHPAASRQDLLEHIAEGCATPLGRLRPDLPRDLAIVVDVALERDPDRRFASAAAFADDLRRVLDGEPILARRPGIAPRMRRWLSRNRYTAALIATLVIGILTTVQLASAYRVESANHQVTALLAQSEAMRFQSRSFEAFDLALAARLREPMSPATLAALQELIGQERESLRFQSESRIADVSPHPRGDRIAFSFESGIDIRDVSAPSGSGLWIEGATTHRFSWLQDGGFVLADSQGHICRYSSSGSLAWQTSAVIAEPGKFAVGMATAPRADMPESILAVGGAQGRLLILDLANGMTLEERPSLHTAGCRIYRVAWIEDAQRALVACADPDADSPDRKHMVVCVSASDGDSTVLATHANPVSTLAVGSGAWFASLSGNGRLLHVGNLDGLEHDVSDLEVLLTKNRTAQVVRHVAFHDNQLAIAAVDEVTIFDLSQPRHILRLPHAGAVSGLAFGPDGRTLLTCSSDGVVQRWDLRIGVRIGVPMQSPSSELLGVWSLEDGSSVVSADENRVHVLAPPPQPFRRLQLRAGYSQLVPVWDGADRFLVSRVGDGVIESFDRAGNSLGEVRSPGKPRLMAGDPPEPIALGTGPNGDAFVHIDPRTGERRASVALPKPKGPPLTVLAANASRTGLRALVLRSTPSADSTHVTTLAREFDTFDWKIVAESLEVAAPLRHACILSDGRAIYARQDGTLLVTESERLDKTRELWRHVESSAIRFVAVSPDEHQAIAGCADGVVALVGIADSAMTRLEGHTATVVFAAFSRDGRHAATGDATGRISLWSLTRRELICSWRAHSQRIRHLAFSPSGDCLLSSGFDGTVCIWPVHPTEIDRLASTHAPRLVRVDRRD